MPLFQASVLKKYISQLDKPTVQKAYKKYCKFFHDAKTQENIRNSKEEQFQEGFLRELFVDILGYTLNPSPKFNLTTELKNLKGAKKVDGAILKDDKALAVIELKGTNTKDLESIRQQAFDYKANQIGCVYVITSNFEKLRFYINNAVDFEEFNLFTLTETEFELFYLCLAKDNLLANKPLTIKEASIVEEENITKKFYGDYSIFKRELYRDLVKQNMKNETFRELTEKNIKLTLFKKSQKLIDRFLFILFAEDRSLLSPNSISTILSEWKALEELDVVVPLYDRYKQYFSYLDTGRKGTDKKEEIFAYNGGLFQPDELLDAMIIDDDLLYRHTKKLTTYDFQSQVDVNILGHIFEHSLNEIESVNAEIEGTDFDKQKTKRKKDGVFYTPKYITKYIVDNTIGKLCADKKQELGIVDEEYAKGRKNRQATTIVKLDQQLKDYRDWLLQLTICDPACGSGAFLNQALDFLIREHSYVDELNRQLFGGGFTFPDIENQILEHNIYGVDLNEESVEIAKLSLWLRTAQPKRKLTSLNNNIKCGNSLIESKSVAGDKAFNWKEQFPEVFEKGGFDVIIGNPPYVRHELISEIKPFLEKKFDCYNGTADLYTFFYEKGLAIMNEKGMFGFITPNKFIESNYGKDLRSFINKFNLIKIIDFGELPVFSDASTFPCIVLINKETRKNKVIYSKINNLQFSDLDFATNQNIIEVDQGNWLFISKNENELLKRLNKDCISLKEYVNGEIKFGLKTGYNEAYVIDSVKYSEWLKIDPNLKKIIKPFVNGTDSRKFNIENSGQYIILAKIGEDLTKYPIVFEHLLKFRKNLEKRSDKGNLWYEFRTCSYYHYFDEPKIIYPDIALESRFSLDLEGRIPNATLFIIPKNDKYLLAILNSKIAWFYFKNNCPVIGDKSNRGRLRLKTVYVSNLPIPIKSNEDRAKFDEIVDINIMNYNNFNKLRLSFSSFLSSKYSFSSISNRLENWQELTFSDFIKEINKLIKISGGIQLTKKDEFEWFDIFEEKKLKALDLKAQINKTEAEIDQMVYELYGLSEEEIKIVENS